MAPRIQFIHIPKCAGSSFFGGLAAALKPRNRNQLRVAATISAARDLRPGLGWQDFQEYYLECRAFQLQFLMHEGCELIGGHFPYSPAAKRRFGDQYLLLTLLREPVERLISNLIWLTTVDGRHPLERLQRGEVAVENELAWLLDDELAVWVAREYALSLGGVDADGRGRWDGATERAIEHLAEIDLIGFFDDFEGFRHQCEVRIGRPIEERTRNVTHSILGNELLSRARAFFTPERRRRCEELSAADCRIYAAARELATASR